IRITPGRVHARADRPSGAPSGKARLRFRLTCVTRIFEKSVFTKFAHRPRAHLRVGERLVARAWLLGTAGGPPCAADHPFPPFCLLSHCFFFLVLRHVPSISAV